MIERTISKFLSANDSGETGGHQAGLAISKQKHILSFFPILDSSTPNPRVHLQFEDETGHFWKFSFIHYNNHQFGGTRNEYRLTCMTEYIRNAGLVSGDEIRMHRNINGKYSISYRRSNRRLASTNKADGAVIKPEPGWRIINNSPLEPQHLGRVISEETGLEFEAETGIDSEGQQWYLLRRRGLATDHTFSIRTTLEWRRLQIQFEPGTFAGPLLSAMGNVDADGQSAFRSVLADCHHHGSQIDLEINGVPMSFDSDALWTHPWNRLVFAISKGRLEPGIAEGEPDADIICRWTSRFAAAVVAILPTEEVGETEMSGYPEGTVIEVPSNRYERDRRNRAAAITIHGTACKGCGLQMGERYGPVAAGFIEIHHVTPVSQLGANYVINPKRDLVPLCPNCHAVVHRRVPPLTVSELKLLLKRD